ncbi:dienelactone hydrolase [Nocardioides gansuensis]|uniref:Dienelactone hydrolase n=1 Tax=Nocardioides gansuensis TaxID=2138300 RepID=A0A2T8FEP0_9ACTN|nr:dienelactone hydrolase family protein [Nocardioides gansuensis]PVG84188.1 dienelactone hydrolase [Nocardioides gansuensis]
MAEVLLFHHAQGLTEGVRAFAQELRDAGHEVHVPDLYDGEIFATTDEGVAHAQAIGFDMIQQRAAEVAAVLPETLVYAGMSLGAAPAQQLTQTRPGARGALLLHGCIPTEAFGAWPNGVPVQVHGMADDPWMAEGDLDAARALAAQVEGAELFVYPGDGHLFTDSSVPDYDAEAATLLTRRVLEFLTRLA